MHQVQDPLGKPRSFKVFDDALPHKRRLLGGLEYHRVALDNRWANEPQRYGEREIPGRDGRHYPLWLPVDVDVFLRYLRCQHFPPLCTRPAKPVLGGVNPLHHIGAGLRNAFAGLFA